MKSYSLSHLPDRTLERDFVTLDDRHRSTLAELLAHLAEFDARRLYLPAAFPSMFLYCVRQLHWCEQAAFKRIRAARTARRFPSIFPALAAGRLHLSAVVLLAPHLTRENADDLLTAATHKSKAEIEQLLTERFPRSETLALVETVGILPVTRQLSPGTVGALAPERLENQAESLSPKPAEESSPAQVEPHDLRPQTQPIAPRRFALQLTMSQELHDKLRYAQELLSHQVALGNLAEALERVLDIAIPQLEKRKFGATAKPRPPRHSSSGGRHVPAHVKRAVWERDGGRCTFVSETGSRCPARSRLEFDHIDEMARGGRATIGGMRLRCRAHNQYGAERTFGVEFMRHKREEARRGAGVARAQGPRRSEAAPLARTRARDKSQEVIPWLRALGFRADEARRAAELCEAMADASLEQRVRAALGSLAPRTLSRGPMATMRAGT